MQKFLVSNFWNWGRGGVGWPWSYNIKKVTKRNQFPRSLLQNLAKIFHIKRKLVLLQ